MFDLYSIPSCGVSLHRQRRGKCLAFSLGFHMAYSLRHAVSGWRYYDVQPFIVLMAFIGAGLFRIL